jgi:hypothetical protein
MSETSDENDLCVQGAPIVKTFSLQEVGFHRSVVLRQFPALWLKQKPLPVENFVSAAAES